MTNEIRVAHQHLGNISDPVDPVALEIPSIEISELGLTGFNAAQSRTALGIAVNIPQFRYNDTYQFQNTLTWVPGNHALKVGHRFPPHLCEELVRADGERTTVVSDAAALHR